MFKKPGIGLRDTITVSYSRHTVERGAKLYLAVFIVLVIVAIFLVPMAIADWTCGFLLVLVGVGIWRTFRQYKFWIKLLREHERNGD